MTKAEFSVGINYWPIRKAMAMWEKFDRGEIEEDFALLSEWRINPVRIFLRWEDFQPEPLRVSNQALDKFVQVARTATDLQLKLWVTIFTGHMSGANWLPEWMLAGETGESAFPVITHGSQAGLNPKNPYSDAEVRTAQLLFIRELKTAAANDPVIDAWDLGNEPSNVFCPPTRESGKIWLSEMKKALGETNRPVTIGLHQQDLEEDRNLGPEEVAETCDVISMHAYPAYSQWARGKLDPSFPLFLQALTGWLSGSDKVWISEFGISTGSDRFSADEDAAALYAAESLEYLRRYGTPGAFWWCFGDYAPALWQTAPLADNPHERSFGILRHDRSPKPVADVLRQANRSPGPERLNMDWIDIGAEEYWKEPGVHIQRLYDRFLNVFSP